MSLLDTASLIVTPNGYKEGKLYSVIPSDGSGDMSVVRATTATRVNSAGLVELVPYNLLNYSQDFSNAYWFAEPGNSVTSNTTAAPDGTTTADTFTATSGNGMNVHNFNSFNLPDGTFTYSIYLKNNGTNLIEAYLFKIGSGFAARGEINFSAETFTASIGTGTITNVGNGWYRVTLTNTYTSGSFTTGTFTTSTTGTRSVFAWGAQLVEGSTAKDYQKTETRLNIPRLDYSNGTCPSLLVEPQRTNIYTWSSSFDNAAWSKTDASIIASAIISPDGLVNASKLNDNTNNAQHGILRFIVGLASPTTISFFVKEAEYSRCCIENYSDGGRVVFNISTMSVVSTSSNFTNATVEEYANGFIRVSATTVGTSGNKAFGLGLINNSGQNSFVGTGTSGIYVYGAQAEAGAYPTSYIPTTSASVTRNADVISKTGISSLIGQTEGTFFVDVFKPNQASLFIFMIANSVGANAYMNSIFLYQVGNNIFVCESYIGGVQQFAFSTSTLSNGRHKLAIAYKQNDFAFYIDGQLIGTDTSGNIPTMSAFEINGADVSNMSNVNVNATALWKTRLTNTQLAQLTTI
jgi:hypothetical protein